MHSSTYCRNETKWLIIEYQELESRPGLLNIGPIAVTCENSTDFRVVSVSENKFT